MKTLSMGGYYQALSVHWCSKPCIRFLCVEIKVLHNGLPLRTERLPPSTMAPVCFTWARHILRTLTHYLDCARDIVFFKDDAWQVANPQDATGN